MRCVFDHYYDNGFDWLKELATTQCLKSRGLERESFDDLIELFADWEAESIKQLQREIDVDLRGIYDDFSARQIDSLQSLVQPLLPKESADCGGFPLVKPHIILSLVELAYAVQLCYYYEWNADNKFTKRDCQIIKDCFKFSQLKIENIEKYDPMNLVHVNIARAILDDPEDVILHLTWIRINYLINLEDVTWSVPQVLKGSSVEGLVGCSQFLQDKAAERQQELRCSRSQSYIQRSECHDVRNILKSEVTSVQQILLNVDKSSHYGSIDQLVKYFCARKDGSTNRRDQAVKQHGKLMRVLNRLSIMACAEVQEMEFKLKTQILTNVLRLDKVSSEGINSIVDQFEKQVLNLAALACDSDPEVGKAEFSLYIMKFANNAEVKTSLKFLERMVS